MTKRNVRETALKKAARLIPKIKTDFSTSAVRVVSVSCTGAIDL